MNKKENKNYFTFGEIIMALRPIYKDIQYKLRKLSEYIKIESDKEFTYNLDFLLKEELLGLFEPSINLKISKKPTNLNENLRIYINTHYCFNELRWMQDNASFTLQKENGKYKFVDNKKFNYSKAFTPKVKIAVCNDQLNLLLDTIKSNEIYYLPNLAIDLNLYQALYIRGDYITLSNTDFDNTKRIEITYNALNDKIDIQANCHYSPYYIDELLKSKIYKHQLPDEYIKLIEDERNIIEFFVGDIIGKKKEELSMKTKKRDNGEKFVLLKKKQRN